MEQKIQKELELLKSNIDSYMIKTEKQCEGKFDVIYSNQNGLYQRRIGYITGGKSKWLAEIGIESIGYFKTKQLAMIALLNKFEG